MSDRPDPSRQPLGQRIATYQGIPRSLRWLIIPSLISVIAWTVGLCGWFTEPVTRLLFVVGFSHLAMTLVAFQRSRTPRRADLHQKGLVLKTGMDESQIAWDQVVELYQVPVFRWRLIPFTSRAHGPTTWTYLIVCRDGRRIRVAGFEGIRGLGRRIDEELLKRLFPLAKASFHAGYIVRFGRRLGISDEGIYDGVKCLPWHEIADATADEFAGVRIAKADNRVKWIHIPVSRIANLQILARLLDCIHDSMAQVFEAGNGQVDEFGIVNSDWRSDMGHDPHDQYEDVREAMDSESTLEDFRGADHRPRYPR